MKYSEEDLQDYLDGIFTGDAAELRAQIEANPEWKLQLSEYKTLYTLIREERTELTIPGFADRIAMIVEQKNEKKSRRREQVFLYAFGSIVVAGALYCISLLHPGLNFNTDS